MISEIEDEGKGKKKEGNKEGEIKREFPGRLCEAEGRKVTGGRKENRKRGVRRLRMATVRLSLRAAGRKASTITSYEGRQQDDGQMRRGSEAERGDEERDRQRSGELKVFLHSSHSHSLLLNLYFVLLLVLLSLTISGRQCLSSLSSLLFGEK